MNPTQQRLLAQIHAQCHDAAYHRYCIEVQRCLGKVCSCLVEVHSRQLEQLRQRVGGLLLDLMNSGLSHRAYLKLVQALEG